MRSRRTIGHLQAAEGQQRELAGHEAGADEPDLPNSPRLRIGDADSSLRAPLDEIEGVHGGLRLRAGKELSECVLLRAVALLERPGRGALDQVERAVGGGGGAVQLAVEACAGLAGHLGDVGEIGFRTHFPGALLDLFEEQRERLVEELDRLEERVRESALVRLPAGEHPVLAQGVLDDERHGLLGADELRDQLRPAPAGDEPEEDLRAGEVAHRGRDRSVVAVERDLDASSDRGAVDRGERDEREVSEPSEELVSCLAALTRTLGRDLPELADVRSHGEHERLPREQEPAPVARAEPAENVLERAQRLLAERVRLLPVLAVVHRHEGDRADSGVEPLELELGRRASHRCRSACSPRGRPRPCRGRCRAR